MSALAEALVAAQRRALAAIEKAYVGKLIDRDELRESLALFAPADTYDTELLLNTLDVLREWGAPVQSAAQNGSEPKKATEGQVSYIVDLLKKGSHAPLAEQDLRTLSFDRASTLINALKSGSYDPSEWDVPF